MLYLALVGSILDYASAALNSVTITNAHKLGRIQRIFAALCQNRFFKTWNIICTTTWEKLNWQTLHIKRRHFDPWFLIHVFSGTKAAPLLKRLVVGFPPRRPGFEPVSGQVGFVVDKVALDQVFSEYFGFPYQSSFHQILHFHNHPGQVQ
jgi:hypothetical protein